MAEHIAQIARKVEVPSFFTTTLERVISVRKAFSAKVAGLDLGSDARHGFFVGDLEKVRGALKPFVKDDAFNVSQLKNEIKKVDAEEKKFSSRFRNFFEVLEVYEPSDAFLNAPDVEAPKRTPPIPLEYTAEVEDTVEEAIFALVTLFDSSFSCGMRSTDCG